MNTSVYSVEELEMLLSDPEVMAMAEELLPILGGFALGAMALSLILGILMIVAMWKIFKKAGTGGWKALIPIYNEYTIYKISWKARYFWISILLSVLASLMGEMGAYMPDYEILFIIGAVVAAIISLVIEIKVVVKLAKAFRKGGGFAVGLIFLPFIFYPILGFGKAKYRRGKRKHKVKSMPILEESAE